MPLAVGRVIDAGLADVSAEARRSEALGFDSVSVGETQHNPFLPLVLVAEHTERVRLGTSVAIAFPRVPHVTANLAWDLSAYSGGRFVLGLGTQVKAHNERRFSVPWVPPGPHLRDYIACMRAIWDSWQHGTKPGYEGEYYQYRLTSPLFNPGPIEQPDIPIVISAGNAFNARLAGEVCDGITVHSFTTFRYIREMLIPALHEGAIAAGKDPRQVEVHGGGFVVTGRTSGEVEQALARTRREIAFYASTRSYASLMQFHRWDEVADDLRRLSAEGRPEEMARLVTDEMVDAFCIVGTWDELPSRVADQCAGLITQVLLPVDSGSPDDDEQLREVIEAIQRLPSLGDAGAAPTASARA
ncbi:MAG: TIGR03617 family F420-dependent LLM class oxidoreductase [Chloroflexi bacterium]|nr:TIGR03617 family F420-dependent LLM class oxidoreductase [Chloroflexota bacterium]MQC48455.1 TIGR03617 family F420-dependent LLM class oxidoreductase [Chloroflexota bacterium]